MLRVQGSYIGGRAAYTKVLHLDIAYGEISSSGAVDTSYACELFQAPRKHHRIRRCNPQVPVKKLYGLEGLFLDWYFVNVLDHIGETRTEARPLAFSGSMFNQLCEAVEASVPPNNALGYLQASGGETVPSGCPESDVEACFGSADGSPCIPT
ncbi:hypothetical protein BDM02DRAFT_1547019 [Thelephora ganbajun]|uniref:Uncharacterized protein n=1 Tax=Thelephora ganbajun TaxID=370292 RepID=A0ACB6Z0U9_THEGA|nr:hypothetical protein BDM02DRAFT_1547019 [Thelephora ganbajun]